MPCDATSGRLLTQRVLLLGPMQLLSVVSKDKRALHAKIRRPQADVHSAIVLVGLGDDRVGVVDGGDNLLVLALQHPQALFAIVVEELDMFYMILKRQYVAFILRRHSAEDSHVPHPKVTLGFPEATTRPDLVLASFGDASEPTADLGVASVIL
jgi:hypothetical protein